MFWPLDCFRNILNASENHDVKPKAISSEVKNISNLEYSPNKLIRRWRLEYCLRALMMTSECLNVTGSISFYVSGYRKYT